MYLTSILGTSYIQIHIYDIITSIWYIIYIIQIYVLYNLSITYLSFPLSSSDFSETTEEIDIFN